MKPEIEEIIKDASWYFKEIESLKAELAEARAKLEAEKEASLHWVAKFTAAESLVGTLSSERLSLQSHNAKLRDCLRMAMIGSCSCLTKTDAPEFHEPDCVYRMIKECLASQPDHELRDRVVAMLKDKYDAMEAACNDDEMRGRSSFWVPYYRHFQKFITELLPSL